MDVAIRFRQDQLPYVAERVWHPSQSVEPQPDGSLILRLRAGGRFEIVRWILGWGDAAEVLAPSDLRDQVGTILASAAARYGVIDPATKAGNLSLCPVYIATKNLPSVRPIPSTYPANRNQLASD